MEEMGLQVLELIQFMDTRWSSEYNMLLGAAEAELANSEHSIEVLSGSNKETIEKIKENIGDSYFWAGVMRQLTAAADTSQISWSVNLTPQDPVLCT
uniref:Uncharacterized protein n=1 Tax=Timema douglasi TaxID=61478 RepID=A0A7R8ZEC4_TIMDO|nr:unnamed protein product [Timema douglasi]